MKTISKRLLFTAATIGLVVSGSPLTVSAMSTADITDDLCARVTTLTITNQAAVETKMQAMQTNFSTRLTQMTSDQSARDKKVAETRTATKQQFEQKITDLLATEGLSETQTQAINTFKISVEKAEAIREVAVDQARQTYRNNLGETVSAQQTALTQAAIAYQAAIKNSFANAEKKCGDGTGALTTLRAEVKTARQALAATRNNKQSTSDIKTMAETRRAAIQAANQAFRTAVQEYAVTLSAALATTDTSTTN